MFHPVKAAAYCLRHSGVGETCSKKQGGGRKSPPVDIFHLAQVAALLQLAHERFSRLRGVMRGCAGPIQSSRDVAAHHFRADPAQHSDAWRCHQVWRLIEANHGQVTDYVRTERLWSGHAGISMSLAAAAAGLRERARKDHREEAQPCMALCWHLMRKCQVSSSDRFIYTCQARLEKPCVGEEPRANSLLLYCRASLYGSRARRWVRVRFSMSCAVQRCRWSHVSALSTALTRPG